MKIDKNQKPMATCNGVLKPARGTRGEALVELAAVVPFVFFLIVLVMNFSGLINAWISVANAALAAAEYVSLSG
jgi:Flp pilus assembly protein TadG